MTDMAILKVFIMFPSWMLRPEDLCSWKKPLGCSYSGFMLLRGYCLAARIHVKGVSKYNQGCEVFPRISTIVILLPCVRCSDPVAYSPRLRLNSSVFNSVIVPAEIST